MKKMRVKSGAVGCYDIKSDNEGKSFKYLDNKWDARTLKNYTLIVEVVERDEEIPKELYSNAPTFNKVSIYMGSFYGSYTWARLCEIIDKRTGETEKCDENQWYLFNQKHLTGRGLEVSEKDKADRMETQKLWDEFKCELDSQLRSMIYGMSGAEWCVQVRSECKTPRYGSSYCPCLRPHPSSGNFHCLYSHLKSNNLKPDAELSCKQLYKVLG